MSLYIWVAIGSMIGGVGRFALSGVIGHRFGETFPWAILIINITGSFAIGLIYALTLPGDGRLAMGPAGRQFFMTGICGGYTTYSSFSLGTLNLARQGDWARAGAYAGGTFVICFLAVWLGHIAGTAVNVLKSR